MYDPAKKISSSTKHSELTNKQQQVKAFGCVNNKSQSKVISADSMIEDLLSKKETFQKKNPEILKKEEGALPPWLTSTPPPLYEKVWQGVRSTDGLSNTPLLSSVLLTSGLPTDILGHIWSLANRTMPGALTQSEVYLVLALVGLAQAGYVVSNIAAIHQAPQAPVPMLDLTLLLTKQLQSYPNTLNVTNLPDSMSFNWTTPDSVKTNCSGQIGVSCVSSGPMMNSNFKVDKIDRTSIIDNILETNVSDRFSIQNDFNPKVHKKSNSYAKRSDNSHSFSFPKLNDSPSHIGHADVDIGDSFDDEFTDFQSASVGAVSTVQNSVNLTLDDEDEFTSFQNARCMHNVDDLSVLVVGGKNVPSTQQLWVADPAVSSRAIGDISADLFQTNSKPKADRIQYPTHEKGNIAMRRDSHNFHIPIVEKEYKQNVISRIAVDNEQTRDTKSMFQDSLFDNTETSLDSFKNIDQMENVNLSNLNWSHLQNAVIDKLTDDEDEFSNFQNYPVTFTDGSRTTSQNTDKYDAFRTFVFQDQKSTLDESELKITHDTKEESVSKIDILDSVTLDTKKEDASNLFGDISETKSVESLTFSDCSTINNWFPSLTITDQNSDTVNNADPSSDLGPVEDKYKALRQLEPSSVEGDDYGEFLRADLKMSINKFKLGTDLCSTQIRCLDACLVLLKEGLSKLSQTTDSEVIAEVLGDTRAETYLNCLLEVHRVSERIIAHLDTQSCVSVVADLRHTWESLGAYYKDSAYNNMEEVVGGVCGVCRSDTGPSPRTFGAQTFHTPCANLYLHCVEPVLPNIPAAPVQ